MAGLKTWELYTWGAAEAPSSNFLCYHNPIGVLKNGTRKLQVSSLANKVRRYQKQACQLNCVGEISRKSLTILCVVKRDPF